MKPWAHVSVICLPSTSKVDSLHKWCDQFEHHLEGYANDIIYEWTAYLFLFLPLSHPFTVIHDYLSLSLVLLLSPPLSLSLLSLYLCISPSLWVHDVSYEDGGKSEIAHYWNGVREHHRKCGKEQNYWQWFQISSSVRFILALSTRT